MSLHVNQLTCMKLAFWGCRWLNPGALTEFRTKIQHDFAIALRINWDPRE